MRWKAQRLHLGRGWVGFQHLDFHDDAMPEFLASEIVPKVKGL